MWEEAQSLVGQVIGFLAGPLPFYVVIAPFVWLAMLIYWLCPIVWSQVPTSVRSGLEDLGIFVAVSAVFLVMLDIT